jgi:hypothetical protein
LQVFNFNHFAAARSATVISRSAVTLRAVSFNDSAQQVFISASYSGLAVRIVSRSVSSVLALVLVGSDPFPPFTET